MLRKARDIFRYRDIFTLLTDFELMSQQIDHEFCIGSDVWMVYCVRLRSGQFACNQPTFEIDRLSIHAVRDCAMHRRDVAEMPR